jgi:hypothetical protein
VRTTFWIWSFRGGWRPANFFARAALAAALAIAAILAPVLVGALVALSLGIVTGLLAFEGVELRVAERRARRFLGF